MITAKVTDSIITAEALAEKVKSDSAGAIATFSGNVRNHDKERQVTKLTYEVHPSAQNVLENITKEVSANYEIEHVAIAHRFGEIPIGDCAFAVAVSSAHRAAAFACCQELVERVKAELPIWKHQLFANGDSEWVNSA